MRVSAVMLVAEVVTLVALAVVVVLLLRARREAADLREQLSSPPTRARQAAGWALRQVVDTAERVRERGWVGGLLMAPIEDLTGIALQDREEITRVAAEDGTVTFLFSDIEDSTRWNEELGDDAWDRELRAHDRVVRAAVQRRAGHVVKSQGDGYMVVFGSPADAIDAAERIQRGVGSTGRKARRRPLRVRIGVHTGTAVARDGDYFGRNVAKAARVAAHADGGQVLVSDETRERLEEEGATALDRLEPAGEVELKGLAGSHALWSVGGR